MDIKQIRYFQAIAQYGSISEAARHLFIVQPALSRQIKELERELATKLFIRRQKGIELTRTGEQLLKDAPYILHALNQAITNVKRVSGIKETLHIGIAPTYTWNPVVIAIIKDFCQRYPEINLSLEPTLAVGQTEQLTQGKLDAGFMAWRLKADTTKAGIFLTKCRLLIASNRETGFATQKNNNLRYLEQEKCLFFPREMSPEFYDFLLLECRKANFRPNIVTCATDFNACLGMVLSGLGYTFISTVSRYNCPANIKLSEHPLLNGSYDFEFVYRKPVQKESLHLLVEFIKQRQNEQSH